MRKVKWELRDTDDCCDFLIVGSRTNDHVVGTTAPMVLDRYIIISMLIYLNIIEFSYPLGDEI